MTTALESATNGAQQEGVNSAPTSAGDEALMPRDASSRLGVGATVGEFVVECKLSDDQFSTTLEAACVGAPGAVSLKVLRAELEETEQFVDARTEWTQALQQCEHPGVVAYQGSGVTRDGLRYVAFEMLHGVTLRKRLDSMHPGFADAVSMLTQLLEALRAAHRQGLVHGDLKPENVLCDIDGSVKLLDFGYAECLRKGVREREGSLLASPAYLSPEQIAGEPATAASDLYSFGLIAHECLDGRHPLATDGRWPSVEELLKRQVQSTPSRSDVRPEQLSRLLHQVVAKAPELRLRVVVKLLEVLRSAAEARSVQKDGRVPMQAEGLRDNEIPKPHLVPVGSDAAGVNARGSAVGSGFRGERHGAAPGNEAMFGGVASLQTEDAADLGYSDDALAAHDTTPSSWGWPYAYMLAGVILGIVLGVGVFLWQTSDSSLNDAQRGGESTVSEEAVAGGDP